MLAWRDCATAALWPCRSVDSASPRCSLQRPRIAVPVLGARRGREHLPELTPDTPFYRVNTFDQTLPFYLKRNVTMVSYKDELAVAIGWEPEKFLPDLAAFEKRWPGG